MRYTAKRARCHPPSSVIDCLWAEKTERQQFLLPLRRKHYHWKRFFTKDSFFGKESTPFGRGMESFQKGDL